MPFVSRTLTPNEIIYGMVEKDVFALILILDACYVMLIISVDQTPHSIYNPGFVNPIFWSQWEAGEMGRVVVNLDAGS